MTGIYCGFAAIGSSKTIYRMCMSIGWNPFYKNEQKTVEPWILHTFQQDFYGKLPSLANSTPHCCDCKPCSVYLAGQLGSFLAWSRLFIGRLA